MRFRNIFAGLFSLLLLMGGIQTVFGQALSDRTVHYTMDVRLDTQNKKVIGKEILVWKNLTSFPANAMEFHLYYNAWRNNKSSFLTGVRYRGFNFSRYKDDEWSYCDIKSVKYLPQDSSAATDLTGSMEYIQPDDHNSADKTVMRIPLPAPVAPGDSVKIEIQWELKVPKTFARTGVISDYYFIAQWFPKVGVFQADGQWNCHQFIQTEFFADYGIYDVSLTVPAGWLLGATGTEISRHDNSDGTTTHRFYQADVHDFVWTTSPYFREYHSRFDEPGLPVVDIRLLLMPDHLSKKNRYFAATKAALKYYGSWWGAYPYNHLTVIDPAYQSRTGGMEYPTLFTGGTRWLSPLASRSPEGVTVHECGHQFWYGIVGNNEFEDAWLDEGFNTYSTTRTLMAAYPNPVYTTRFFYGFIPIVFSDIPIAERTDGADFYDGFRSVLKRDPMGLKSYLYGPGSYGVNSYNKPAMMLRTLENYLGWETFQKIMSTYFARWKFKHPKPQDFFNVVNEISPENMDWFLNQVYNTANIFDYAVDRVYSSPISPPRGYVQTDSGLQFQKKPALKDTSEKKEYKSLIYVRRWGEGIFPVDIKITFENGDIEMEKWDGKDRWRLFSYTKPARVQKVEVDPTHVLVLDVNSVNNTWLRKAPAEKAAKKWAGKWMLWIQNLFEFMVFFV